jgi:hypothetical protein
MELQMRTILWLCASSCGFFAMLIWSHALSAKERQQNTDDSIQRLELLSISKATIIYLPLSERFVVDNEEGELFYKRDPRLKKQGFHLPEGLYFGEKPSDVRGSANKIGRWFSRTFHGKKPEKSGVIKIPESSKYSMFCVGIPVETQKDGVTLAYFKRSEKDYNSFEIKLEVSEVIGTRRPVFFPLLELPIDELPPGKYRIKVTWSFLQVVNHAEKAFEVVKKTSQQGG